jgi:SAM-dependent methyltransferase
MRPETPDFRQRAQLSELMDGPCSRDQLRLCLRDISRLNRWFLGYRPTLTFLDRFLDLAKKRPIRILDVGSGYGDTLHRVADWARANGIAAESTGIDLNPDTIAIAREAAPREHPIEWIAGNIFDYHPEEPFDLVISSLFTHHLGDREVMHFLEWMEVNTSEGWLINDLSRAMIPYHLLQAFTYVARMHEFVQHDAPVSIARAFTAEDWQRLCREVDLQDGDIEIRNFTPARLCVMRRKMPR